MRILAFSDVHGNVDALRLLQDRISEEDFDYMLIAGDLTNADLLPNAKDIIGQVTAIFNLVENMRIPYFFVWGTPNRELEIVVGLRSWRARDRMKASEQYLMIGKETEDLLLSLKYGKCLNDVKLHRLGPYKLTCEPKLVDEYTIFMPHCYRQPTRALIQLEGHLHYGQRVKNYLNLGFLFRDEEHGASSMTGCYWILEFEGKTVNVEWVDMGNQMKKLECLKHFAEGTFYVPHYWKNCPVCLDSKNAVFTRNHK